MFFTSTIECDGKDTIFDLKCSIHQLACHVALLLNGRWVGDGETRAYSPVALPAPNSRPNAEFVVCCLVDELGAVSGDSLEYAPQKLLHFWSVAHVPQLLSLEPSQQLPRNLSLSALWNSNSAPWEPLTQWNPRRPIDVADDSQIVQHILAGKRAAVVWRAACHVLPESVTPMTVCLLNVALNELVPCVLRHEAG